MLHPVRLRIVLALAGQPLTTAEIRAKLPDVSSATLYRQVAILHEANILAIADEQQKRGAIERTYELVEASGQLGADDAAAMTPEQHISGITSFVGSIINTTARYVERDDARPGIDTFGYRQIPLWLNPDEADALVEALGEAIAPFLDNDPDDRDRTLLNVIIVPDTN
jgi:predicted DNA-binding transcriptional regulator YafY